MLFISVSLVLEDIIELEECWQHTIGYTFLNIFFIIEKLIILSTPLHLMSFIYDFVISYKFYSIIEVC